MKRIIRAKVQLMLSRPFYGSLAARLQLKQGELNNFATDGKYLYFPKDYDNFTDDELIFIIAHEVLHCALLHVFRRGKRNPLKWNIASDYCVNDILIRDGFRAPKGILYDKRFSKMTAEKIYSMLEDDNIDNTFKYVDLIYADGEEAEEMAEQWKGTTITSLKKFKGDFPGELEEIINNTLCSKIPWQHILYRYLNTTGGREDFRSYPFDRRHIYREVYLPSMSGGSIEICCAIDTSGSMSNEELSEALSEVRSICSIFGDYTIYLFQCDVKIHDEKIITSDSEVPNFVIGRGGTSFVPVFKRIEELNLFHLPLVYFTDLCGDFPSEARNHVYWITKSNINPPFGTVIKME